MDLELKADFKQNNPLTRETICCLCHFPIDPRAKNGWSEHVFNSQYLFLENISSEKQIRQMGIDQFEIFSQKQNTILDELDPFCASIESEKVSSASEQEDSEIENIIERIKKINTSRKDEGKATKEKRNAFLYQHAISSMPTDKVKGDFPISDEFLCNMIAIVRNKRTIHHSHMTGKIIGYAHDFCNQKCRENYYAIPVLTHNHFRFDFFLFLKGIRPSVWETLGIEIGGKSPTDINFVIIRNQVRFIDTVKYFQQSLGSLADSMTDTERDNVRKICRKFLVEKLMFLNEEDEKWVLDYLTSGKGMIPYQMINNFDSLNIRPETDFFKHADFYSSLKEKNISEEEYENVKKIFMVLRLKTLGDLNRIYNSQDIAILCEIFEQRSRLLQKLFKFNGRKCNSASSFSGCVQRLKSKCCVALPTNAKIVRVFEKTLIGGYSCVNDI